MAFSTVSTTTRLLLVTPPALESPTLVAAAIDQSPALAAATIESPAHVVAMLILWISNCRLVLINMLKSY